MAIKEGQTATNPQTGQRVVYRAGQWMPLSGPQPVSLTPKEEADLSALRTTVSKSGNTYQQAERFGKLNEKVATGPGHAGGGFNPINWFNNSDTQAMQSITDALAPAQRIEGSGSSSDKDVAMFRSALPSIDKYGGANAAIIDNLKNQSVQDRARLNFYEQWAQKQGTLSGAPEAFQQKLDEIANAPDQATASALVQALVPAARPNRVQRAMPAKTPKKANDLYSKYGLE